MFSILYIPSRKTAQPPRGLAARGGQHAVSPFSRARRIGISVSRRTQVTEPVLRPPLRCAWRVLPPRPTPASLPPCQPRKDRDARATRVVRVLPISLPPVPTPGSTDTLSYSARLPGAPDQSHRHAALELATPPPTLGPRRGGDEAQEPPLHRLRAQAVRSFAPSSHPPLLLPPPSWPCPPLLR
jgi:hypothetical protein